MKTRRELVAETRAAAARAEGRPTLPSLSLEERDRLARAMVPCRCGEQLQPCLECRCWYATGYSHRTNDALCDVWGVRTAPGDHCGQWDAVEKP